MSQPNTVKLKTVTVREIEFQIWASDDGRFMSQYQGINVWADTLTQLLDELMDLTKPARMDQKTIPIVVDEAKNETTYLEFGTDEHEPTRTFTVPGIPLQQKKLGS